jgi:hypothetical protein
MDREGDPGRIRRQQQVMRALAKQMTQVSPFQLPGLIQEVQKQFNTDMTPSELASAAAFAKNLGDTAKIQPLTLFGTYYQGGSIRLNKPKNEKLLAYIFGNTFNSENFLNRSPSTTEDEIGPTNNAGPETKAILQAAGIIKSEDDMLVDPNSNLPTLVEETRTAVTTERGNRYASANQESNDAEKPRRSRSESRSESSRTRRVREKSESEPSTRRKRSRKTSSETSGASESSARSNDDSVIIGPTAREESGTSREGAAEPPAEAPAPAPPTIEAAP